MNSVRNLEELSLGMDGFIYFPTIEKVNKGVRTN